jgi:curved DNA-binding protein CbpA
MTSCHKGGIKIRDTGNNNTINPLANINPFNNPNEVKNVMPTYGKTDYEMIDLDIENYSRNELFNLFGVKNMNLSEDTMKDCKRIVLKTHPDKSQLDPKYYQFFAKAYNKLKGIYEFQNKIQIKKTTDTNEYFDSDNGAVLDKVFDTNTKLKDPNNFNKWFNDQFDKHKVEDDAETGYGGWLKSDEDIVFTQNVTKSNMAAEMEKRKREVQTLTTYNGVNEQYASTFGGSALMAYDSNFTSNSLFSGDGMGYTDLRQAYVESVIPVTEDDYRRTQKFNSVDEYKRHRDSSNTVPLSKEEAMKQLFKENKQKDEESAALAYFYAQQTEKAQKNQANFWSGLKQISNS